MKASTQYNDFVGTSAADIGDENNLTDFLKEKGVDITRYKPVGASFYAGYADSFYPSIICTDEQASAGTGQRLIKILLNESLTRDEFFDLFKRMEVVFFNRFSTYSELDFREENLSDLIG